MLVFDFRALATKKNLAQKPTNQLSSFVECDIVPGCDPHRQDATPQSTAFGVRSAPRGAELGKLPCHSVPQRDHKRLDSFTFSL
jgi:hypothetical protein